MAQLSPRIPEDEARALWQRAIELQVSAEKARTGPRRLERAHLDGLSLDQVVDAAEGAGIDPIAGPAGIGALAGAAIGVADVVGGASVGP